MRIGKGEAAAIVARCTPHARQCSTQRARVKDRSAHPGRRHTSQGDPAQSLRFGRDDRWNTLRKETAHAMAPLVSRREEGPRIRVEQPHLKGTGDCSLWPSSRRDRKEHVAPCFDRKLMTRTHSKRFENTPVQRDSQPQSASARQKLILQGFLGSWRLEYSNSWYKKLIVPKYKNREFRPVSYENRIILRAIILNTHPGGKLVAGRVGRHSNSTNWKNRFFRVRVYHSEL